MNGECIEEIKSLFPHQEAIARKIPSFDALEEDRVLSAIKKSGRKKVIISGLWTSMCFTYTALHALKEGFEVYGLMDSAGDSTPDAHLYGVKRMLQAGVVPVTLVQLTSEWMHDWANPKAGELMKEVYSKFDAMLGM